MNKIERDMMNLHGSSNFISVKTIEEHLTPKDAEELYYKAKK